MMDLDNTIPEDVIKEYLNFNNIPIILTENAAYIKHEHIEELSKTIPDLNLCKLYNKKFQGKFFKTVFYLYKDTVNMASKGRKYNDLPNHLVKCNQTLETLMENQFGYGRKRVKWQQLPNGDISEYEKVLTEEFYTFQKLLRELYK